MSCNQIVELPLNEIDLRFHKFRPSRDSLVLKMVESMRKNGQLTPLVVGIENKVHVLLDGFKRYQAAASLKMGTVFSLITPHRGALMKSQIYLLNHGNDFSLIDEGLLVQELVNKDGLTQVEVGSLLGRHKSWVSRRLSIINNLESQIIEDIQLGLIPVGSAVWLAQLPRCNQGEVGSVIQYFSLGNREIKRFIELWRRNTDIEKRNFLIKHPLEAIEFSRNGYIDPSGLSKLINIVSSLRMFSDLLFRESLKKRDPLKAKDGEVIKAELDMLEEGFIKGLGAAREILQKKTQEEAEGSGYTHDEKPVGEMKINELSPCFLGKPDLFAI